MDLQKAIPVTDSENQFKTPKRTRNADEVLPKSVRKTPSRKQMDDLTPRKSVRSSTRLLNLAQSKHSADTLTLTPQNGWIESEVPSTSKKRAKSGHSATPEENEIAPVVPTSAKKRSKSLIATPKKANKLRTAFEMSNTAIPISKSEKSCTSPTETQGSTEVLPTFDKNDEATESTKKRGKSLMVTQKKTLTTPKIGKRSHSLAIVALNMTDDTNDAIDKSNINTDTSLQNTAIDNVASGGVDTDVSSHEVSGSKENNVHRVSVVDLTEISVIESDSPIKNVASHIDSVVESALFVETVHDVDITPLKDIKPMLRENLSMNNSSLICLPDTPELFRKPLSTLNDTFSPVEATCTVEKPPTIILATPLHAAPQSRSTNRTLLKTPITYVKRLKSTPGRLTKREQTPYKPISTKSAANDLRFVVASTPAKLLEAAIPLSCLKSIRKRSFSVDCIVPKKGQQRVTFHSPANKEIPIDEIDLIMEMSHREEKRHQENIHSAMGFRRKRSFSNAETAKEKARPPKEPNAEDNRGTKHNIPDFAAIHKRVFDRMESIDEYKNRTVERSKNMLSNQKLQSEVKGVTATADSTAKPVAKKNLFDTSKAPAGAPKTMTAAVLAQSKLVKPVISGYNNKLKNRQIKNKEAYKAGSNKPKVSEAVAAENKTILKGVRSNRRFDLQMKFRNTKD